MKEGNKLLEKWAVDLANTIQEAPECIETRELMIAHFKLWGKRLSEHVEHVMCNERKYDYIFLNDELECVDGGMGFLILQLNLAGIKTLGSCSGHGNNGYPHVLCVLGTEEKLKKFGCKIINTRTDGKVKAYFPCRCFSGRIVL